MNFYFNRSDLREDYLIHLGAAEKVELYCFTQEDLKLIIHGSPSNNILKDIVENANNELCGHGGCFLKIESEFLVQLETLGSVTFSTGSEIRIRSDLIPYAIPKDREADGKPKVTQECKADVDNYKYKSLEYISFFEILKKMVLETPCEKTLVRAKVAGELIYEIDTFRESVLDLAILMNKQDIEFKSSIDEYGQCKINQIVHDPEIGLTYKRNLHSSQELFIFADDLNAIKNNKFLVVDEAEVLSKKEHRSPQADTEKKSASFDKKEKHQANIRVAKMLANEFIAQDKAHRLKTSSLCNRIHAALVGGGMLDLPKLPESIRPWIEAEIKLHVYLTEGGRPKKVNKIQ